MTSDIALLLSPGLWLGLSPARAAGGAGLETPTGLRVSHFAIRGHPMPPSLRPLGHQFSWEIPLASTLFAIALRHRYSLQPFAIAL